jgi:type II secretion system protein G
MHTRTTEGFTLIELIVVMAIVALLVSIAAPRYFLSVENARDQSLRTSLRVMRDAIDQFQADKGRYPQSLEELRSNRYLREIPEDPITGRRDSWVVGDAGPAAGANQGGMLDVHSGATELDRNGQPYSEW